MEFVPTEMDRAVTGFKIGAAAATAASVLGGYFLLGDYINNHIGIENVFCRGAVDLGSIVALMIPSVPVLGIAGCVIGWYSSPAVDFAKEMLDSMREAHKIMYYRNGKK